jgi:cytochrome c oxidase subunit 3
MSTVDVPMRAAARAPRRAGSATTGVWVGVATISMSFAAYTSALIVRQGSATDWLHFHLPFVLYLNTAVIVASSVTLERARRNHILNAADGGSDVIPLPGPASKTARWLGYTLLLGILFVAGQLRAWQQLAGQGLYLATNPSSSFFYIFTALHGLHLLGGLCALVYVRRRLARGASLGVGPALTAASLYWHFMAVLWVSVLLLLIVRF